MHYKNSKTQRKKLYNMSNHDKFELSLLNLQLKIVYIYMLSDVFLVIGTFENINLCYNKKEIATNPILLLLQGQYLALFASILIGYVDFSRYTELNEQCKKGDLNRSLEPEYLIRQASVVTIILYILNIIGETQLYKASFLINIFKCGEKNINDLYLQAACFIMRFYGDYFLLNSTLKSINLIKSKYDNKIRKIENPDIDAVIASELYVIQRGILYDIDYNALLDLINNGDDLEKELLLLPNEIIVMANIFGVIANITSLTGIIRIYARNVNEPIFGR